jgi:3'(2'), 5'-bisphosphate nucleotidase
MKALLTYTMKEACNATSCHSLAELAIEAGGEIMRIYAAGLSVEHKSDHSPVTEADRNAEAIILEGLARLFPDIPVVAEEACSAGSVPAEIGNLFFLVDPLDGTREFINRRSDFTVNIALISNGTPVTGVVYAPARGELYCGFGQTASFWPVDKGGAVLKRRTIAVRPRANPPVIVASRSHRTPETDAFIENFHNAELISVGSSLKFCMLAAAKADIYPRFGRTMEWDTAAGDAILRAAGGKTILPDGSPLVYGKRKQLHDSDFANPHFIAFGGS